MNLSTAITGLRNALFRQNVTANNVANVNTNNYQARQVVNVESSSGGVRVGEVRADQSPGAPVDILDISDEARSNVDLATEQTNTILNRAQFQANAASIRAQDELLKSVLDLEG